MKVFSGMTLNKAIAGLSKRKRVGSAGGYVETGYTNTRFYAEHINTKILKTFVITRTGYMLNYFQRTFIQKLHTTSFTITSVIT